MRADPTTVRLCSALGLRGEATPTDRAEQVHLGTERASRLPRLGHSYAEWWKTQA